MPSLAFLTALLPWFKRDTMSLNPWTLLFKRTFSEPTDTTLYIYASAAEKVADPQSAVDRLDVVWVWQLKDDKGGPYHEVAIVETEDRQAKKERRCFVLERVYHRDGRIDRTEVTEVLRVPSNIE